jgi:hypothetical protein
MLPLTYPKMTERRRRALAQQTLREFLDDGLVSLRRFHFTREIWWDVPTQETDALLANDEYWAMPRIDSWQVRFETTPKGNRVCPGPPQGKDGWMSTTWWFPKRLAPAREPSLPWTLRHTRRYVDGTQSAYQFYWPILPILNFYKGYPDDPNERLCYFWREVGAYCWSVLRLGSGDEERHLRTYVGLWLIALKLGKSEWRDVVKKQGRPLDSFAGNWMSLR